MLDHLHAINQIPEKTYYDLKTYLAFKDQNKAFDSVNYGQDIQGIKKPGCNPTNYKRNIFELNDQNKK